MQLKLFLEAKHETPRMDTKPWTLRYTYIEISRERICDPIHEDADHEDEPNMILRLAVKLLPESTQPDTPRMDIQP